MQNNSEKAPFPKEFYWGAPAFQGAVATMKSKYSWGAGVWGTPARPCQIFHELSEMKYRQGVPCRYGTVGTMYVTE